MAVKRNGLGKGLDSLIPNKTVKTTEKQANKTTKRKSKSGKIRGDYSKDYSGRTK